MQYFQKIPCFRSCFRSCYHTRSYVTLSLTVVSFVQIHWALRTVGLRFFRQNFWVNHSYQLEELENYENKNEVEK